MSHDAARIFVPYNKLAEVIGHSWSRQQIANLIKDGRFPPAVQISQQRIAWRYVDLMTWAEERSDAPVWQPRPDRASARRARLAAKARRATRVMIEDDEYQGAVTS